MGRAPGILFFTGRANAENAAARLRDHPLLVRVQNTDGDRRNQ